MGWWKWGRRTAPALAYSERQEPSYDAPIPRAQIVEEVSILISALWSVEQDEAAPRSMRDELADRSMAEWARHVNETSGWRYHMSYRQSGPGGKRSGGWVPERLDEGELVEALRLAEVRLAQLNVRG
jgi:hypothetical protein